MNKFFKSSFFILTTIAILSGSIGALLTGAWDLTPPPQGIYSYGNYIDGAKFGAFCAVLGLIPYWIFHLIIGDATNSWKNSKSKKKTHRLGCSIGIILRMVFYNESFCLANQKA